MLMLLTCVVFLDNLQVQVTCQQENAVFHTRCWGQHTHMKHCRSCSHWEYWSMSSVRTQMVYIDCREFHVTGCLNYTAMLSTNAVRSAEQSTSVHLLHVHTAWQFLNKCASTVTVITVLEESVSVRLACVSYTSLIHYFCKTSLWQPHAGSGVIRIDLLCFLARCHAWRLKLAQSVIS